MAISIMASSTRSLGTRPLVPCHSQQALSRTQKAWVGIARAMEDAAARALSGEGSWCMARAVWRVAVAVPCTTAATRMGGVRLRLLLAAVCVLRDWRDETMNSERAPQRNE